ncbi:MAG: FAD-dependent oxidoreductase [bacterium]|nr:FAD-dependent oxidoreductase [bacterium]
MNESTQSNRTGAGDAAQPGFEPYQLGNLTLPNRFVMGSMHLGLEGAAGVAERMAAFYARRFKGGVGLIVTGGIGVSAIARGSNTFFDIQNPEHAAELREMNALLKSKYGIRLKNADGDAKAGDGDTDDGGEQGGSGQVAMCAQLFHAGRYAFYRDCVAPSAIRSPINRFTPRALSEEECWQTVRDFGAAAKLAIETGFGAVEIMASEGYLINQFCSPVTNQRDDHFGGDAERRMNMALEVLKAVRANVPAGFPVIVRMSGIDLIPDSSTFEEVCKLAAALRDSGATALNIGIGWHESRVPTISQLVPRGAWAKIAGRIKRATPGIPIIASNRVNEETTMRSIFENEEADIISMARPFLADAMIINKIKSDEAHRVNTCIACNQACLDHGVVEKIASCIVNPEAVNELEYEELAGAEKKRVLVIGSGPGGLEAARVAAARGHEVILLERADRLGGQLNLAAEIPGKFEFRETIRYFEHELRALGVHVRLKHHCDLNLLEELDPDAVIFATGVRPREIDLPGLDSIASGTYVDYLTGKFQPGRKVAVLGGGGIGIDVAHKLTHAGESTIQSYFDRYNVESYTDTVIREQDSGPKVAVFKRTGKPGAGLGPTTIWALKQELAANGVEFHHGLNYKAATADGLQIEKKNGESYDYDCDSVLLCIGQVSENTLARQYHSRHPEKQIFVIGGARDARGVDAKRAFLEGNQAACAIGVSDGQAGTGTIPAAGAALAGAPTA